MNSERKYFETKSISGYTFFDYWGLQSHPLFIKFNKKVKSLYLTFDEVPFQGSTKVSNLTDIRDLLYRNEWAFEEKYWKIIKIQIATMVNIPWTPV
jgi:hypothetical protein